MKQLFLFAILAILFAQNTKAQVAMFSYEGNLCLNTELSFTDESSVPVSSWSWDFGDGSNSTIQNPTHTYTDTGTFIIELSISSNSSNYDHKIPIHIAAKPEVNFTIDSTQFKFSSYTRVFTDSTKTYKPVSSYVWNFNDNNLPVNTNNAEILYKFSDKGAYNVWLKVIDSEGCTDSTSNIVQISDRFFVPNVFTPNEDNINDNFIVTSNGVTLFSIEIYSRWGNLVFKRSGHEQIIWDGQMPDGSKVKPGTYYYVINSETSNVSYETEKGFITVFY